MLAFGYSLATPQGHQHALVRGFERADVGAARECTILAHFLVPGNKLLSHSMPAGWMEGMEHCAMVDSVSPELGKFIVDIDLENRLGQGSYKTVYLGNRLGSVGSSDEIKPVAVAVASFTPEESEAMTFTRREVELYEHVQAAWSGHAPNVARLFGSIVCNEPPCRLPTNHVMQCGPACTAVTLVTELCEGGELQIPHPLPSPQQIAAVFRQVLTGLVSLHLAGVASLDVKPANLLVKQKGPWHTQQLRVSDLGLAFPRDDAEAAWTPPLVGRFHYPFAVLSTIRGTPGYICPELWHTRVRSAMINPFLCDVYAVGVSLFEVASGGSDCVVSLQGDWSDWDTLQKLTERSEDDFEDCLEKHIDDLPTRIVIRRMLRFHVDTTGAPIAYKGWRDHGNRWTADELLRDDYFLHGAPAKSGRATRLFHKGKAAWTNIRAMNVPLVSGGQDDSPDVGFGD